MASFIEEGNDDCETVIGKVLNNKDGTSIYKQLVPTETGHEDLLPFIIVLKFRSVDNQLIDTIFAYDILHNKFKTNKIADGESISESQITGDDHKPMLVRFLKHEFDVGDIVVFSVGCDSNQYENNENVPGDCLLSFANSTSNGNTIEYVSPHPSQSVGTPPNINGATGTLHEAASSSVMIANGIQSPLQTKTETRTETPGPSIKLVSPTTRRRKTLQALTLSQDNIENLDETDILNLSKKQVKSLFNKGTELYTQLNDDQKTWLYSRLDSITEFTETELSLYNSYLKTPPRTEHLPRTGPPPRGPPPRPTLNGQPLSTGQPGPPRGPPPRPPLNGQPGPPRGPPPRQPLTGQPLLTEQPLSTGQQGPPRGPPPKPPPKAQPEPLQPEPLQPEPLTRENVNLLTNRSSIVNLPREQVDSLFHEPANLYKLLSIKQKNFLLENPNLTSANSTLLASLN